MPRRYPSVAFAWLAEEMRLTHLSLTNFRNFTRLDLDIPAGTVMLVGDNAQGKTSLLEAIYFLATLTSFHASSDKQLINFIEARRSLAVARIVADFNRGLESHRLEVRIIQEPDGQNGNHHLRKEILVDGVKRKAGEAIGQFNAVLFLPQMMGVIEAGPEERRRYLNLALSQVISHYQTVLAEYNKALLQRNALLKQLFERRGDTSQLDYWDDQIATFGAQLIHARIRAIQELEKLAARTHRELTHANEVLRLSYQPAYDPLPQTPGQFALPLEAAVDRAGFTQEQIRKGFLESLQKLHLEEIGRGVTTIGPHRDELRFLANGIDLGIYGSRGQARSAILALKIAEVAWMHSKSGHWPVLLLDEVLAELDTQRRFDLLERLNQSEQVLLSTTDLDLFASEFVKKAAIWRVADGRVEKQASG
ncbi:MAG TPA: DNA replication/repair protein RecF [Anaerolineales bacterium]|nr:DNA replication/repair protein RecF [Anaerolineales bacterium]